MLGFVCRTYRFPRNVVFIATNKTCSRFLTLFSGMLSRCAASPTRSQLLVARAWGGWHQVHKWHRILLYEQHASSRIALKKQIKHNVFHKGAPILGTNLRTRDNTSKGRRAIRATLLVRRSRDGPSLNHPPRVLLVALTILHCRLHRHLACTRNT